MFHFEDRYKSNENNKKLFKVKAKFVYTQYYQYANIYYIELSGYSISSLSTFVMQQMLYVF